MGITWGNLRKFPCDTDVSFSTRSFHHNHRPRNALYLVTVQLTLRYHAARACVEILDPKFPN